ncbi:iron(III) transport system permease protein [Paraburkholderia fungorum]|uniref:Iron(III) transport system permease protein n=1 Tax=Paraburkholderia fungorum TaxID=134537 RepID=A0A1H1JWC3_9BURK|nr:iron ABC transporter permease [Paraburkholderia fungorum]SDR53877.1 iron(III) transport system permease protein [Paraburkholderia fungorum]
MPSIGAGLAIVLIASAALAMLIVYPVGWVISNGFHDDVTGALSLANFTRVFGSQSLLQPILNSVLLALSTAFFSTLIGVPMAWLVSRTDMPGRTLVKFLTMGALITPSFIGALGWILLAAPNSGWLNHVWRMLAGASSEPLLNIYSMGGAIFVCAVYTVPYTFTIVSSALENMAVELEDAATTLGSGILRTMLTVTIPLVMPAVMVGFILSFIQGVTLFGVPAFLLTPAHISVVTTRLADMYEAFPPQLDLAAAYCMPLLALTASLFYLRKRVLGRRRYDLVGGKSRGTRVVRLGNWRWLAILLAMFVPVVTTFLPYAAILIVSLSKAWGLGPSAENLTLHWYRWALLDNQQTLTAIVNSLKDATLAATGCIILGTVISYMVERRLFKGAILLGAVATVPIVIPGIVLSVGFFSAYTQPLFGLYGTSTLLILAFVATFLPISYSHGGSILKGISPDLERASRILGSGQVQAFTNITAPLMGPGLISGWLLVFIPIMRELSVAIFLVTPQTNVMTTLIYNYKDGGNYEAVCATSVVLLIGTMLIVALANSISRAKRRLKTINRKSDSQS